MTSHFMDEACCSQFEPSTKTNTQHTNLRNSHKSYTSSSIRSRSPSSRICSLFVSLVILVCVLPCSMAASGNPWTRSLFDEGGGDVKSTKETDKSMLSCSRMNYVYNALARANPKMRVGVEAKDMRANSMAARDDNVCQLSTTCCTPKMEKHLLSVSTDAFQRNVQDRIMGVRHSLEKHGRALDQLMRALIAESSRGLHSMFSLTYGAFYTQHADVFQHLFNNLTQYYSDGHPSVDSSINTFYAQLFSRMFFLLNPQYGESPAYTSCLIEHVDVLRPFGHAPDKLRRQIVKSMQAARTLSHALSQATDAVKRVDPSSPCASALLQMTYCPHCGGEHSVKPCHSYCSNVAKGCLAEHADLDDDWHVLVDSISTLLERLRTDLNVETALKPIDMHISEAIMMFQEQSINVTDRTISPQMCGAPPTASMTYWRVRRSKNDEFGDLTALRYGGPDSGVVAVDGKLKTMADTIEKDLKQSSNFWSTLPASLCTQSSLSATDGGRCWNGSAVDTYDKNVVGDGLANQMENPEVPLKPRPNPVISQQMLLIRMTSETIKESLAAQSVSIPLSTHDPPSNVFSHSLQQPPVSLVFEGSGDDDDSDVSTTIDRDDLFNLGHDRVEGSGSGNTLDLLNRRLSGEVSNMPTDDEDLNDGWIVEGSGDIDVTPSTTTPAPASPPKSQINEGTWHLGPNTPTRPAPAWPMPAIVNVDDEDMEGSGDDGSTYDNYHPTSGTHGGAVVIEPPPVNVPDYRPRERPEVVRDGDRGTGKLSIEQYTHRPPFVRTSSATVLLHGHHLLLLSIAALLAWRM